MEGLYFITSLPWLKYTQLIQPTAGGDESNPRISWGRAEADLRGRQMMPVTLLAHHALVDGLQVARFYQNLDGEIAGLTVLTDMTDRCFDCAQHDSVALFVMLSAVEASARNVFKSHLAMCQLVAFP